MKTIFRSSAALVLATSLTACTTPGADMIVALPQATQKAAFERCSAHLNVPAQLQKIEMSGGRVSVFAVNGNGVSLAQARSLNQCSRATLIAEHGEG